MIGGKIRQLLNEFRDRFDNLKIQNEKILSQNENLIAQNAELEWAHIFHDTIKDKEWLLNLGISPGRWAGNYSFFYILVRVLADCKPNKIIEFGLGESSKIVSSFLKTQLLDSSHLVIEQDRNWIHTFLSKYALGSSSNIVHLPLEEKNIHNLPVNSYSGLAENVKEIFDLYIIDGPFGSVNYSRYDICFLAEKLRSEDEFVIIIDDYQRPGEKETVTELLKIMNANEIKYFSGVYSGVKSQFIIATEQYKYVTSL